MTQDVKRTLVNLATTVRLRQEILPLLGGQCNSLYKHRGRLSNMTVIGFSLAEIDLIRQ